MALTRRRLRSSILAGVALVVALILLYLFLYLNAGKTESAYPAQPENVAYGAKPAVFYNDRAS